MTCGDQAFGAGYKDPGHRTLSDDLRPGITDHARADQFLVLETKVLGTPRVATVCCGRWWFGASQGIRCPKPPNVVTNRGVN